MRMRTRGVRGSGMKAEAAAAATAATDDCQEIPSLLLLPLFPSNWRQRARLSSFSPPPFFAAVAAAPGLSAVTISSWRKGRGEEERLSLSLLHFLDGDRGIQYPGKFLPCDER